MKNIKKIILGLATIFFAFNANAQNNDSIDFFGIVKKLTTDSTSQYYYPQLLEKVKTSPADINMFDCFYLYYGQIFQPNYKPIGGFLLNPERVDFDRAAINGNCKKAIKLGTAMLERNPVDLTVLLYTCICIKQSHSPDDEHYFAQRYDNLLQAIFSTGDGKSIDGAIKIISIEDDYVLKGSLGFFGGKETLEFKEKHCYSVWTKRKHKLYFEDIIYLEK
ncbi:MAG: DUF4919 domain-containing protein [Bacteroidales bacterium]|nr:DUF4919 domain-containing protein [Bacteroidales bacterium]